VLVHVDLPGVAGADGREELHELAVSAGAIPVETLSATRDAPHPRYFVGTGKGAEIRARVEALGIDVVIFGHPLTPAQERNLERLLQCRVLDRISLILDIFAQRATSYEGKLQVELAQLKHLSTRLVRGWTHLERQKGGIGLRGPGEKQLETDRRLIGGRIKHTNRRLAGVSRRRQLSRRARHRAALPVVALVGYTNAGKSTLFNRLTGAETLATDRLFATLDPLLKRLDLAGERKAVLADTVGFIRKLPHDLVAAFRATLEETRFATLLLHVIDAADADRAHKITQVNEVLADIGAEDVPQIEVYNKIDTMNGAGAAPGVPGPRLEHDAGHRANRVWISAKTGCGVELVREALFERLGPAMQRRRVRLPVTAGRFRARLFKLGVVIEERSEDTGGWIIDIEIAPDSLQALCRAEGLDQAHIAA